MIFFEASHHSPLRCLAQQSSEGDDRRHAGAVQEEEGGQTLQTDGVCVVGQIVRSLSLDVEDHPTKDPVEEESTSLVNMETSTTLYHQVFFMWRLKHEKCDALLLKTRLGLKQSMNVSIQRVNIRIQVN